jgi:hypothetical protein
MLSSGPFFTLTACVVPCCHELCTVATSIHVGLTPLSSSYSDMRLISLICLPRSYIADADTDAERPGALQVMQAPPAAVCAPAEEQLKRSLSKLQQPLQEMIDIVEQQVRGGASCQRAAAWPRLPCGCCVAGACLWPVDSGSSAVCQSGGLLKGCCQPWCHVPGLACPG